MSKRGVYYTKQKEKVKYKSSWELNFMRWLDANDNVFAWKYEPFFIYYISSERQSRFRKYIPDFLVLWKNDIAEIIEIKPKCKINRKVIKKAEAALQFAYDLNIAYSFMTEVELKELSILK